MTSFEKNIISLYGDQGRIWLKKLPALLKKVEQKYSLSNLTPLNNLSYNYVLAGTCCSQPIVLKIGLDFKGLEQEVAALKALSGFGSVKMVAAEKGLILLKQVQPGYSLKSYFPEKEVETIHIASNLIKQLHKAPIPSSQEFPQLDSWLRALDKEPSIPDPYLKKAIGLKNKLLATSTERVLLHGDLHHENILKADEDWIAIDPKGVIGEPIYEVTSFIRNPLPDLFTLERIEAVISCRISSFSSIFKFPASRIREWCFVQSVLSWAWALEDKCDESYFKQLTEIFNKELKEK
jgi:streptomycin 6-kinase